MARFTFRLPDIGEGIAEAEIVAWHVKVGDRIEEDGGIADMMTDKATVEMESPVSGVVVEIAGEVGDMVAIGSALAVIEVAGEDEVEERLDAENPDAATAIAIPSPPAGEGDSPPASGVRGVREPEAVTDDPSPRSASLSRPLPQGERGKVVLASPAVRARAADLGIDLTHIKPSEDGRLRHADLDAYLRYSAGQGYAAPAKPRADEAIKVIGMRRRIAENMAASKRAIPHFTYVDEIDVTELEDMRGDLNANRGDRPKLDRKSVV